MPRPVVVALPPTAVALEPNGESGSLPRPVSSCVRVGSSAGGVVKRGVLAAASPVRSAGGAASTIFGTNTPVEASRLAA